MLEFRTAEMCKLYLRTDKSSIGWVYASCEINWKYLSFYYGHKVQISNRNTNFLIFQYINQIKNYDNFAKFTPSVYNYGEIIPKLFYK